jgi:hypothetical protein
MFKKIIAGIVASLISLFSFVVSATPANADNRITISAKTNAALYGSGAFITSSLGYINNVYGVENFSSYNWAKMKYEVQSLSSGNFVAKAEVGQETYLCNGITSSNINFRPGRTCITEFSNRRIVLNANTSVTSNGATLSQMKITQLSGEGQIFRIRSWVDSNNNDSVDPFEPASTYVSISGIDPKSVKNYLAFQVDPPRFSEGKIVASIGENVSGAIGVIDPTLVTVKVHACGVSLVSCKRVSGSLTYNSMPQLLRYEFISETEFQSQGIYAIELFYQQDANTSILLQSKNFDYSKQVPTGVKTQILPRSNTKIISELNRPDRQVKTEVTLANLAVDSFVYQANLVDSDSKLTAKRDVYVYLDLKEIKTPADFLVDGVRVTSKIRDEVVLKRTTDESGQLKLLFEYPEPSALERVEIDLQVNGIRPYELSQPGSVQAFVWDLGQSRSISMYSSSATGSSTEPITISSLVATDRREIVSDAGIVFTADEGIVLDFTSPVYDRPSITEVLLRISNSAPESGQGYVTANSVSLTGLISSKILVSWTGFGKVINVSAPTLNNMFKALTNVEIGSKSTTVTVYGAIASDRVTVCRAKSCLQATFNKIKGTFTRTLSHSIAADYKVLVNNVVVYTGKHK